MKISDYPFTREAAEHVRSAGYSLDSLINKSHFEPVRVRAVERLEGAVKGEIPDRRVNTEIEVLMELLSYPLARVMISCLGDEMLSRRYALAEAKLAHKRMGKERAENLILLANDLGLSPSREGDLLKMHFSEYIRAAHRLKSPGWKLVNRDLKEGYLTVTLTELARLMEEVARDRVLRGLPLQVGEDVCSSLKERIKPIRQELEAFRARQRVDLGKVTEGAFPPCIQKMLSLVASGSNLAHTARFALTSFLLQINMSTDQVVEVFNTSPDFDEERTRYQVEHIAGSSGTKYKPPSCATMATYGNCPGEDELCKRVSHPLSYYEKRTRSLKRQAPPLKSESNKPLSEKSLSERTMSKKPLHEKLPTERPSPDKP
jgi:DNA primase large subunit